ncbi:hypothetical protein PC129_g22676 [Phytophthora cactorum]|uniref:Uncharacterized protein n=2 Tax=Phytophthora cactorum TaxID=29920 RepID=A0A329RUE8_9STRA|nr:hypothetical protein PC111_g22816 [Phytophthora cactorum]KAG2794363.1 hypothetical protein PC112_g23073 [Phytophthora cactorum]KAG2817493.1 hypothetical protein PC113_g22966 [Phytophthora cactorum]KAG2873597.1 hypothetical protein PC114_g25767 [Phytophthora cactorum]KAG2879015.1 hypothetical protein PC115_g22905 [Phytophthora cactorum]
MGKKLSTGKAKHQATPTSVPTPQPTRKKFAGVADVVLLRAVSTFRSWRAPVGTANGIMKVFEDIAVHCDADPEFVSTSRTNDWDEKIEADNRIKQANQQPMESSGELMRRLAMNEASDDDSQEDVSDSPADESSRKRSAEPESAKKKITKKERLAVVMDALTESLKTVSEEDRGKYEYKSQRLAFEKEQAEEKRRYDADEAEKRRQHELELEGRRKKSRRGA